MKNKQKNQTSDKSRRNILKAIAAGSGAIVAGKSLPDSWSRPVVDSVMLPAHAQTSSIVCPVFAESSNWYETAPQSIALSSFGQIRLVVTLQNIVASNLVLDGTVQIWTSPNTILPPTLPVVVNSPPIGTFTPGSTFTYDLTIDTSGLPSTELAIAFRGGETTSFGQIAPSNASIVSSTSVCG